MCKGVRPVNSKHLIPWPCDNKAKYSKTSTMPLCDPCYQRILRRNKRNQKKNAINKEKSIKVEPVSTSTVIPTPTSSTVIPTTSTVIPTTPTTVIPTNTDKKRPHSYHLVENDESIKEQSTKKMYKYSQTITITRPTTITMSSDSPIILNM